MKAAFYKSPQFKKWSLFTSLVIALGFNLSWNPENTHIVRLEKVQTFELAQTASDADPEAANVPATAPATVPGPQTIDSPNVKVIGLEEVTKNDSHKGKEVTIRKDANDPNSITYSIGSACTSCATTRSVRFKSAVQLNDPTHIKGIAAAIAVEARAELDKIGTSTTPAAKPAETSKASDTKASKVDDDKESVADACADEEPTKIASCMVNELKDRFDECRDAKADERDGTTARERREARESKDSSSRRLSRTRRSHDRNSCTAQFNKNFGDLVDLYEQCSMDTSTTGIHMVADDDAIADCKSVTNAAFKMMRISPTAGALKSSRHYLKIAAFKQFNEARARTNYAIPSSTIYKDIYNNYTQAIRAQLQGNRFMPDLESKNTFAKEYFDAMEARNTDVNAITYTNGTFRKLGFAGLESGYAVDENGLTDPRAYVPPTTFCRGGSCTGTAAPPVPKVAEPRKPYNM